MNNSLRLDNIGFKNEKKRMDSLIFTLKWVEIYFVHYFFAVALCMSAWIEITNTIRLSGRITSHSV
ncbi:hypothetical protein UB51_03005 [Paenibacillus sp. IHBB 10380]|nr:hypothetical protein UB51_03005 [Paenibacillus sp. IHBB 10380]